MRSTGAPDRMHPCWDGLSILPGSGWKLGETFPLGSSTCPSWSGHRGEARRQRQGVSGSAGRCQPLRFPSPFLLCSAFSHPLPLALSFTHRSPSTGSADHRGGGSEGSRAGLPGSGELPPPLGRGRLCPSECECIDISLRMPSDSPEPAVLEGRDLELLYGIASRWFNLLARN